MIRRTRAINFRRIGIVSMLVFCALLGASCARDAPPSGERLALGKPVTKQLKNDEVHSFTVKLDEGHFIGLSIEQHDVDVITKGIRPLTNPSA